MPRPATISRSGRNGARAALPFFARGGGGLRAALKAGRAARRRVTAVRNRLLAKRARHDTRKWQVKRRERTRQLIELGGPVIKAGLVDLTEDDRALLYGSFLATAIMLRSEEHTSEIQSLMRISYAALCLKK